MSEYTLLETIIRLASATFIGAVLGADREIRNKPAGMRTHALVSLGSALVVVTTLALSPEGAADPVSRAIQGIIAGVGFLGAGAILKARERAEIRGLTTAASIWLVASLGIACGAGYWAAAIVAVLLALVVLIFGNPLEEALRRMFRRVGRDEGPGEGT
jgi:putative Mg2+ transporter-C (MgtC) family protein